MTREDALKRIKALREEINDVPDPTDHDGGAWVNEVCHHLDAAADVIEFPRNPPKKPPHPSVRSRKPLHRY